MSQSTPAQARQPTPHRTLDAESDADLKVGDHRVRGAGRLERGKHVSHRRGDLLIGIDDGIAVDVAHVADGQRKAEFAAGGGCPFGSLHAASQDMQLGLRHGALSNRAAGDR